MTPEEHLRKIQQEVYAHLREKGAPPTARNIIHAMFDLRYADWIGHIGITPSCDYEYVNHA